MNELASLFQGRSLIISSKHQKHQALSTVLSDQLGVEVVYNLPIDTDELGTFSGEVERASDAYSTLRKKCLLGMEKYGYDLGVATEGSFGPHPSILWSNAHEELIVFIDKENNLEISERLLTLETNFNHAEVANWDELLAFAGRVQFPSHKIILTGSDEAGKRLFFKGMLDETELQSAFERISQLSRVIRAETDMRAMFNPTRMGVIKELGAKLVNKVLSHCPKCSAPGFGEITYQSGLPCQSCGYPTQSILTKITNCNRCGFGSELLFPNGKISEDPMFCDFCNP